MLEIIDSMALLKNGGTGSGQFSQGFSPSLFVNRKYELDVIIDEREREGGELPLLVLLAVEMADSLGTIGSVGGGGGGGGGGASEIWDLGQT